MSNDTAWINNGEQIILMMDSNENIFRPRGSGLVSAIQELGLREVILERHDDLTPPNTYNRGNHPINGIFASPTIKIRQGGYDAFYEYSDHRLIWIDIETERVFGEFMYKSKRPNVRRLRYDDRKGRKKFFKKLKQHFTQNNIYERVTLLDNSIQNEMSNQQKRIAEKIDKEIIAGIIAADAKCRHIYYGTVPYTAEMADLLNKAVAWRLALKRIDGRGVNSRTIIRAQRRAGYSNLV